ncbi:MAG: lipid-A-disaccharide synthase N-terminal domain-containing protein [Paracoccus sp. (in: a-proteobacteria)]|uniref:lipid-A-disaccharide synthase N-terminal domain-containing protein n=1 Tax=Paracoccus sp. TaxID=267 RepID=UPI002E84257A|nr:lipid-A-disaccharide synthase N-terminal domain-containing protein [Pseudomonadota bacterium]
MASQTIWLGIGFLGQALFSARFVVQWLASERVRQSVVPHAFWWFSLAGGITLLAYALWRQDPVFVLGQSLGLVVYVRNLMLISRHRRTVKP